MSRKPPVPDFEERQEEETYFTNTIISWVKLYGYPLLVMFVIGLCVSGAYIYWQNKQQYQEKRTRTILGKSIFHEESSPNKKVGLLKPNETLFRDHPNLYPWYLLHLSQAYYIQKQYTDATRELYKLKEFRNKQHVAVSDGQNLLKRIRDEKEYMKNQLPEDKKELEKQFQEKLMIYGIEEQDLPKTSE